MLGKRKIYARVAAEAPLEIESKNGRLSIRKETIPHLSRPTERKQRIVAQRSLVEQLIQEAERKQLPSVILRRFLSYAKALAVDEPTCILLDGPMAILSASLDDEYIVAPLDAGFLNGWRHLVESHSSLLQHISAAPVEERSLGKVSIRQITPTQAKRLADDAVKTLQEGRLAEIVDPVLVDAVAAMQEYLEAAEITPKSQASLLIKGLLAIAGTLIKITQFVAFPASVATLAGWVVTPQGRDLIVKIEELIDRILAYFIF